MDERELFVSLFLFNFGRRGCIWGCLGRFDFVLELRRVIFKNYGVVVLLIFF